MDSAEQRIVLLDYGVGNIGNLINCFGRMGFEVEITSDPERVSSAEILVLPGVGAFEDALDSLKRNKLVMPLKKRAAEGKPLLGFCLGMQVMFEISHEYGIHEGLGIFKGTIEKFDDGLRIPHMGWNEIIKAKGSSVLKGIFNGDYVYFVHSYKVAKFNAEDVLMYSEYGGRFPAAVQRGVVAGFQFHPEKSGIIGMNLLKNYLEYVFNEIKKEEG